MNKKYILGVLLISILFGITTRPAHILADSYEQKLNKEYSLDNWINALGSYENCPKQGMVDSNGKLSYGRFCFQLDTFKKYVKKYNLLPQSTDDEIINMIDDTNFQTKLVKLMILDNYSNWRNWYNSVTVRGLGKPQI